MRRIIFYFEFEKGIDKKRETTTRKKRVQYFDPR